MSREIKTAAAAVFRNATKGIEFLSDEKGKEQ
jgi:hypothetical protein